MNKYIGGIIVGVLVGSVVYMVVKKAKNKVDDNISKITIEEDINLNNVSNEVIKVDSESFGDAKESIVKMNEQFNKEISNETIDELEKQQARNYDIF